MVIEFQIRQTLSYAARFDVLARKRRSCRKYKTIIRAPYSCKVVRGCQADLVSLFPKSGHTRPAIGETRSPCLALAMEDVLQLSAQHSKAPDPLRNLYSLFQCC